MLRQRSGRGGRKGPDAEFIGHKALLFLAESPERLGRFLAETGIGPQELRAQAGERETLAAVLAYVLGDDSQLLVFAAENDFTPESVHMAHAVLTGEIRQ